MTCEAPPSIIERVRGITHPKIVDFSCHYCDGRLVLSGKVTSYYEKQLAQEAAAKIEGVSELVNQIEVVGEAASGRRGNRATGEKSASVRT